MNDAVRAQAAEDSVRHDRWLQKTDVWLVAAAVITVPLLLMEGRVGATAGQVIQISNWVIWGFFAADLAVRLLLTNLTTGRYLRRYWFDVAIVLLSILPVVRPLRVLRSARVLRLLRLATVATFVVSLWRGRGLRVWRSVRGRNMIVVISGVVVLAPILVWLAERNGSGPIDTIGESVWWGAATMTTVGYGDVAPVTWLGRSIAIALMLSGITGFGVITANMAARFAKPADDHAKHDLLEIIHRDVLGRALTDVEHASAAEAISTLRRIMDKYDPTRRGLA